MALLSPLLAHGAEATPVAALSPPPYDGPSPSAYRWINSTYVGYHTPPTYAWAALPTAAPAVAVTWAAGADPYSSTCVPLASSGPAFAFQYYGTSYNCVWINENGFLVPGNNPPAPTVPAGNKQAVGALPATANPANTIGGYLADLDTCSTLWHYQT
ncbi:MAG: hypothetical protein LC620_07955, partial [Halobacteriales archaeon]|nr:hypothetical protein [Halobacteriales archaeon]